MGPPSRVGRQPIVPGRIRRIDSHGFAFLPNRFLQAGFFVSLTRDELALYLLLVLAGDKNGVSFYHFDSLCSMLGVPLEHYLQTRNALIDLDLIAFDGTRYQVLSLPDRPVHRPTPPLRTPKDLEDHDPATIRALLHSTLVSDPDDQP